MDRRNHRPAHLSGVDKEFGMTSHTTQSQDSRSRKAKMNIAIIGSGKVGSALGTWFANAGVSVVFTSRDEGHSQAAAEKAQKNAKASDVIAAIKESDILFLTLPFTSIEAVLEPAREHLSGKILVDVTNPITADHRALSIGHTDSGAETIARLFPTAHVVKAFNAIFAEVYAGRTTQLNGRRLTVFYAGDDLEAKKRVCALIGTLGFDPVDAGPLQNARYLEPLSLLNIHLGRVLGFGTQLGMSLLRPGD